MRLSPIVLVCVLACAAPLAALAADAPPPAAVAACQAEYVQLGADAFKAKYGPTEPFGHCYAAHTTAPPPVTTTTTTTTATTSAPSDDAATAACKAEYVALGPDAFKAKYGPTEPLGHCVAAHTHAAPPVTTTTTTTTSPPSDDPATAACKAEYVALGPDAFKAKYGAPETFGNCVAAHKQAQPTTAKGSDDAAKSLAQALCKGEASSLGKDAFAAKYGKEALGQCVKATLAKARAIVAACKSSSGSSKDAYRACLAAAAPKRR